jgi:phosphoribosylaminoimidazolecarboxamide formyltransferase/IMP cyclohydrolase
MFFEIIIAPDYDVEALKELKKKKSLRVIKIRPEKFKKDLIRSVSGGLIIQSNNLTTDNFELSVVTSKKPSDKDYENLKFAWMTCSFIKSNAIVLVKNKKLVGMGAGQPNRLMSVKIAGEIAGKNSVGSVLASDAFFPFPDALEEAIKLGVKAVIQPGGSINDQKVIDSADRNNISMIFTKQRRFLH